MPPAEPVAPQEQPEVSLIGAGTLDSSTSSSANNTACASSAGSIQAGDVDLRPSKTGNNVKSPSWCFLLGLNAYNAPNNLALMTLGIILLPAEAKRLFPNNKAIMLGVLLLVTGITQLICPFIGLCTDRCSSKYGKRRPFIAGGVIGSVSGFALMWLAREKYIYWLYFTGLFIAMIGMNISYSGFTVINTDFVDDTDMGKASGAMAMMALAGACVGFGLLGFTFIDNIGCAYPMYMISLILGATVTCCTARERVQAPPSHRITSRDVLNCYRISHKSHGDFFYVFIMRTFYYMSLSVQAFIYYYLMDWVPLGVATDATNADVAKTARRGLTVIVLTSLLGGAIVTLPMGKASDRYGKKRQVAVACVFIGCVFSVFCAFPPLHVLYGLAALYGVGNGAFLVVDYAIAIDCLPDRNHMARDLGLWGIGAFLGSAVGPMSLGALLYLVGNEGGGRYSKLGYQCVFATSCVFVLISGAFVVKIKGST